MNYLLLKQGSVIKSDNIEVADILVGGNKILQIDSNIKRPTAETPVIDATGKFIMPGSIDINRGFLNMIGCPTKSEEIQNLNRAQVYNGTTTMIDSIEDIYKKDYLFNIQKAKKKGEQNCIDYSYHLNFSKLKNISIEAIDFSYIHEGISSFSINISSLYNVQEEVVQKILSGILNNNLLLVCELSLPDQKKGKSDKNLSTSNTIDLHFKTLKMLLELGVNYGCSIIFSNILYVEEYNLIQSGLSNNADFYGTLSLPFNIGITDNIKGDNISNYQGDTKLTYISEEAIWQIVNNNRFIINTPSYNLISDTKSADDLVFNRPDKFHYIRNFLSMLFTLGVNEKQITLQKLVDITSTMPAKLMGMYPQKGVLSPGADADILVWNPEFERNLYCTIPTKEANNKKYKLKGRCDFVFSKGRMIYNGELYDPKPTQGEFVYRSALEAVHLE